MGHGHFFSLRYKLILAFFAIGFVYSLFLGGAAYKLLADKFFSQLRDNVGNLTLVGAQTLDKDALARLVVRQNPDLSRAEVDQIEGSTDFALISQQLNFLRDAKKSLIRYVYLITPTGDQYTARYLVDADVLNDLKTGEDDDKISHFNSDLDVTPFPVMGDALRMQKNLVEKDFTYDAEYNVNSVSAYAPVYARDGQTMLALLAMDIADTEVHAALNEGLGKTLMASSIFLLASVLTTIALGTLLTRGIITLDNLVRSFADKNFAVRAHLKSNDEVGRLGRSFNVMAETIQSHSTHLESLADAYGRFVPHDLLKMLEKRSILDVNLGDQTQKEMAVLFSDIRNFTSMSEMMTPEESFNFINAYLNRVGPLIRSHNGIIDKYIGDAVMALFPACPSDAIEAALAMQETVHDYNSRRKNEGRLPIKIGVGIHTGKVMLGTIGEARRMDGTIISDAVNLTSRIEGLTKKYGCSIIVSGAVLDKLEDRRKYFFRLIDKTAVAGKTESVAIYEICDADDDETIKLKQQTLADYNKALEKYYAREFAEAKTLLEQVLAANANDTPARLRLDKVTALLATGIPDGWDGITRYDRK